MNRRVFVIISILVLWIYLATTMAVAQPLLQRRTLPQLNVELAQSSVSGLSAGAFMADQFFVAYSNHLRGVGAFAGGPFGCSRGDLSRAVNDCMHNPALLTSQVLEELLQAAQQKAAAGLIDPLANLRDRRAFLFSGTRDETVLPGVTDRLADWYQLAGMPQTNLMYKRDLQAGHTLPTRDYGNLCDVVSAPPWMSDCDYDGAGEVLRHIYGQLNPPQPVTDASGILVEFNQNQFFEPSNLTKAELRDRYSFNEFGYAYIPQACMDDEPCKIHVVFHGCKQVYDRNPQSHLPNDTSNPFGLQMVLNAGFNEWANSNRLIILYPQVQRVGHSPHLTAPGNPNGCFDWWAYIKGTTDTYNTRQAPQMAAVFAMMQRLAKASDPAVHFDEARQSGSQLKVSGLVTDADRSPDAVLISFMFPPNKTTAKRPADQFDPATGRFDHLENWPANNTVYIPRLTLSYADGQAQEHLGPAIVVGCRDWTDTNSAHHQAGRAYRKGFWFLRRYFATGSDDALGFFWSTTTVREEVPQSAVFRKGVCTN